MAPFGASGTAVSGSAYTRRLEKPSAFGWLRWCRVAAGHAPVLRMPFAAIVHDSRTFYALIKVRADRQ